MKTKIAVKNTEKRTKDKLFNFRPLFFAAIFLCLGILFSYGNFCFGVSSLWALLLLPIAVLSVVLVEKTTRRKAVVAWCVLLALFVAGAFSFAARVSDFQAAPTYDSETSVQGRVVKLVERDGYYLLELDDLTVGENATKGKLNAYLPASFCENLHLSDTVLVRGILKTDTSLFDDYGFRANDIRTRRCYRLSSVKSLLVIGHSFDLFAEIRSRMHEVLYAGMSEDAASITFALLTGDSSGIDADLLENVRAGGIAHVFAVSGLHIGSLFAACMLLTEKTRVRKRSKIFRFALTAAMIWLYVGVCGFTSSSMRAAVICLVGYAAKLVGVKNDFLQALGVSALTILSISPVALFEVGFQLSFAACLGLELLASPLRRVGLHALALARKRFRKPVRSDSPPSVSERIFRRTLSAFCVSLSAQIATAPVLLQRFGYVSGWSLLLNVVFVPIVSGAFALLLILTLCACVLPTACSAVLLGVPSVLWQALLLVFEIFDFSAFAWTKPVSSGAVVAYYLGWCFATDKWNISAKTKRRLVLACFATFLLILLLSAS